MKKILLAGASGYLGKYIAKELKTQNYFTSVVVRGKTKFENLNIDTDEIYEAQVTDKQTLQSCFKGIDTVISSVGITRQKDGLTYMDVDYQANKNLLDEAKKNGVNKFIYVSVLSGDQLTNIQICKAKELFVDQLKKSGLEYCIIRPSGFFSDMEEFYKMAEKGRIYLFGNGRKLSNPIHGADLAEVCVNSITTKEKEIKVGGPEIFSQQEIAEIAFDSLGKTAKITYIPDWIRKTLLKIGKFFMSKNQFGPIEFFLTVMDMDLVGSTYGEHKLYDYYKSLKNKSSI